MATLQVEMGTKHQETTEFLVMNIGEHDILLGTNWLLAHNPSIDWANTTITMNRCPKNCFEEATPQIAHLLPSTETIEDLTMENEETSMSASQCIRAHLDKFDEPTISRTTVSTALAVAVHKEVMDVPHEFRQYAKVFSDEEAQRLPKHQPWDHKIDLIPDKQMRKTSVYRLTPPERVALKEYIAKGLKRGTLRRSEAPDACSFFFIDKKDGKLRPVQDYRPLNEITRKNAAPIPLIPDLVDKLLGA